MDAQLPGVPVRLHHLRLAHHVFVVAVGHVALAHEGLEVRAELHRVGRIHVDGLHLAAEALVSGEGVHHHQGIAEDQPVHPPVAVLVCLEQPIADGEVALPEEIEHVHLAVAGMPLQGLQDRGSGQPLVHEQGQGRHVEGEPLGLPGPVERRGKRWIVTVGGRQLLLAELRLHADVGPQQRARLGVRIAAGAPSPFGPARLLLPGWHRLRRSCHTCCAIVVRPRPDPERYSATDPVIVENGPPQFSSRTGAGEGSVRSSPNTARRTSYALSFSGLPALVWVVTHRVPRDEVRPHLAASVQHCGELRSPHSGALRSPPPLRGRVREGGLRATNPSAPAPTDRWLKRVGPVRVEDSSPQPRRTPLPVPPPQGGRGRYSREILPTRKPEEPLFRRARRLARMSRP